MKKLFEFDIPVSERLDKYLQSALDDEYSRSKIAKWIADKRVTVNGEVVVKNGFQLEKGYVIEVDIPDDSGYSHLEPLEMPLEIVYEDEYLAVINKPAHIAVHPAPSIEEPTLVNALKYHFDTLSSTGGAERAGIVHRLDKETTGLLIIAKNDKIHTELSQMFQDRNVVKIYKAIIYGRLKENEGTFDFPIGRSQSDRKKMAVRRDGRHAVSHYKVLETIGMFSVVNLSIETGRTHQIRVHLTHTGHPIIGDKLYGTERWKGVENTELRAYLKKFPRHALHAALIKFTHPVTGEDILLKKSFPDDLQELLETIRKYN